MNPPKVLPIIRFAGVTGFQYCFNYNDLNCKTPQDIRHLYETWLCRADMVRLRDLLIPFFMREHVEILNELIEK